MARRVDLVTLKGLLSCKDACNTSGISRETTVIRRKHLTAEFKDRITNEMQAVGLEAVPLRVSDRSVSGDSFIGVSVNTQTRVNNKEIMSEGEFQALALACFLAEVNGIPGHNGIILDDPVCSFDHLRTERVAKRLIQEASNGRQVIIFTHDLVFYHELENAALVANVPHIGHWIQRKGGSGPGFVNENTGPWQITKVKQRLDALDRKIPLIKQLAENAGSEEYRIAVKDFYTDVRETWERLVEEQLLGGTVCRYQREVKTKSLKGVVVENRDYQTIFLGMKRVSGYSGHDAATGEQVALPSLDEINGDLKKLRDYHLELKAKIKKTETERKLLEKPILGQLM